MASQVLSGTNTSLTYTNNTGQNVRVVINYLGWSSGGSALTMTAGNMIISVDVGSGGEIGRNLAFNTTTTSAIVNASNGIVGLNESLPTEIMLAPGQVFSVSGRTTTYNIVVIPES